MAPNLLIAFACVVIFAIIIMVCARESRESSESNESSESSESSNYFSPIGCNRKVNAALPAIVSAVSLLIAVIAFARAERRFAAIAPALQSPALAPMQPQKSNFIGEPDTISEIISSLDTKGAYPGAIDGAISAPSLLDQEWPGAGTTDRLVTDNRSQGDVYNFGRTAAPPSDYYSSEAAMAEAAMAEAAMAEAAMAEAAMAKAAMAASAMAEANDEDIDGDEANTYQVRARNDMVRATAGTMRRQRDMDKYLREEVAEAEDRYWWGRHEL